MKTLNLTDLEKSEIKYKISKFPDGQNNITIEKNIKYYRYGSHHEENQRYLIHSVDLSENKEPVQIKSRLNNWLDLELIVCAVASLRELDVEEIHLYTPYIMGARSDRKFEEGGNNYIKDVIAPVINSLGFKTVTCIDPHSYSLECCIKNFKSIDNSQLVKFALNQIYNENKF